MLLQFLHLCVQFIILVFSLQTAEKKKKKKTFCIFPALVCHLSQWPDFRYSLGSPSMLNTAYVRYGVLLLVSHERDPKKKKKPHKKPKCTYAAEKKKKAENKKHNKRLYKVSHGFQWKHALLCTWRIYVYIIYFQINDKALLGK